MLSRFLEESFRWLVGWTTVLAAACHCACCCGGCGGVWWDRKDGCDWKEGFEWEVVRLCDLVDMVVMRPPLQENVLMVEGHA